MRQRLRSHLSYANVTATLALFLVLSGGTAVALSGSNTVFSDDIVNGQVRTADIYNEDGVRSADVRDDFLSGGGLQSIDLATNSVEGSDIALNSITSSDVAPDSLSGADIATDSLSGTDVNEAALSGVAHTSGPFGAIDILQEDIHTSVAYSASDPDTFIDLGHPFELRSPATANDADSGFRLCNTSTAQFGVTVYIGGTTGSTSDTRSAPVLDGGTCTVIDYNSASGISANGDFRLHFSDGEVLFGTGAGIDTSGGIDILAIGGFD